MFLFEVIPVLGIAAGYVGTIYIWKNWIMIDRDDPRVISRRLLTSTLFTILYPSLLYVICPSLREFGFFALYGLKFSIWNNIFACLSGIFTICCLFAGHIYNDIIELQDDSITEDGSMLSFSDAATRYLSVDIREFLLGDIKQAFPIVLESFHDEFPKSSPIISTYIEPRFPHLFPPQPTKSNSISKSTTTSLSTQTAFKPKPIHENRYSEALKNLRNNVFAPITEEICFRGCMTTSFVLLFHQYFPLSENMAFWCVFLGSPILFSIAHAHHLYNRLLNRGCSPKQAIVNTFFQLGYTFVFGLITSYLYLRTGNVLTPLVAHVLCNIFGIPSLYIFSRETPPFSSTTSPQQMEERKKLQMLQRAITIALYTFGIVGCGHYFSLFTSSAVFSETSFWALY